MRSLTWIGLVAAVLIVVDGGTAAAQVENEGQIARLGDLIIPLVPGLKPNWSESGDELAARERRQEYR
jgi:hypothetical protein